tara:strand:- start:458 stop:619 length:162 start_codon:yes stop_codon:yes gene_type:complete
MNIKDVIDQITYINEDVADDKEKRKQLHELGWQLINATRPKDEEHPTFIKDGE